MSQTITIDDQDLSHIKYNGSWARGGSAHEYDSTVASSTVVGDSFTVSFHGTSIVAYGTIDASSGGSQMNFSIDDVPPATVTSQAGSGDTFNQQFWKSPALALGQHRLNVVVDKVNSHLDPGEGTIWFDYFVVTDPTIKPPGKKINKGAIAGGVISGVVVLLILSLHLLFFVRRRRKRDTSPKPIYWPKEEDRGSDDTYITPRALEIHSVSPTHPSIIPYVVAPEEGIPSRKGLAPSSLRDNTISFLSSTADSRLSATTSTNSSSPSPQEISPRENTGEDQPLPTNPKRSSPIYLRPPSSVSVEPEVPIQHRDSGIRNITPELAVVERVELPPVYSPV